MKNIAELKASGYKPKSVKQEMRDNLIAFLKGGKNPFVPLGKTCRLTFVILHPTLLKSHCLSQFNKQI